MWKNKRPKKTQNRMNLASPWRKQKKNRHVSDVHCSVSRLIPVYLIVAGFVGALAKFISKTTNRYLFNVTIFLVVFYFVWHGLGTYWVYKEYQPNYVEEQGTKYCDR
ncbi:unnamed protein product, partial [Tenebrio molitor]